MSHTAVSITPGVDYFPGFLDRAAQEALRDEVLAILDDAPPFRPRMPRTGKPFSVIMSNCGALGWVSDERGYRYQATHPETGRPWPAIHNAHKVGHSSSQMPMGRSKRVSWT